MHIKCLLHELQSLKQLKQKNGMKQKIFDLSSASSKSSSVSMNEAEYKPFITAFNEEEDEEQNEEKKERIKTAFDLF
jgi:hypothetical protein